MTTPNRSPAEGERSLPGASGGERRPVPGGGGDADVAVAMERLDDQLEWYDKRAGHHRLWYLALKLAQIVVAAAIPVLAAAGASSTLVGGLGALIVVLEAVQQLFQFHQNWLSYRGTAEALKRERQLFGARAAAYADAARPAALLAERVEGLVSSEVAAWTASQRADTAGGTKSGDRGA